MIGVAGGMVRVTMRRGLRVPAGELGLRRAGYVRREMDGQPGIERHGKHAEPRTEAEPSQSQHVRDLQAGADGSLAPHDQAA